MNALGKEFQLIKTTEIAPTKANVHIRVDRSVDQIEELFDVCNPVEAVNHTEEYTSKRVKYVKEYLKYKDLNWAWYPWKNTLVKVIPERDYTALRSSRNKDLITKEEQKKFANYNIAIAGLSVGNSIALTIRLNGGCKYLKLADPDTLSISNLNRIRAGITELGLNKAEISRRQILELDPYSKVTTYCSGITEKNINKFINRADVIIDEVDNIKLKTLLRFAAIKRRTPLFMFTDNDDGVLVDYYPYHKGFKNLFHGVDNKEVIKTIKNIAPPSKQEMVKLSSAIVGKINISSKMLLSLQNIGKSLYTWPQLGTAASMAGVVAAYLTRELANGREPDKYRQLIKINTLIRCN